MGVIISAVFSSDRLWLARPCFDQISTWLVFPYFSLCSFPKAAQIAMFYVALRAVDSQARVHVTTVSTTNECHSCLC